MDPHRTARLTIAEPHQRPALPEWQAREWLNAPAPPTLQALRGRVVLLHTFQMLCPGCVAHGLPQAERVWRAFPREQVAVVGLHTVFEHHAVMTPEALRAFVHEYGWSFPIGVDVPADVGAVPRTMARYGLRGTPTHLVLDARGRVALHHFGSLDDLVLGAAVGSLLAEVQGARSGAAAAVPDLAPSSPEAAPACSAGTCESVGGAGQADAGRS